MSKIEYGSGDLDIRLNEDGFQDPFADDHFLAEALVVGYVESHAGEFENEVRSYEADDIDLVESDYGAGTEISTAASILVEPVPEFETEWWSETGLGDMAYDRVHTLTVRSQSDDRRAPTSGLTDQFSGGSINAMIAGVDLLNEPEARSDYEWLLGLRGQYVWVKCLGYYGTDDSNEIPDPTQASNFLIGAGLPEEDRSPTEIMADKLRYVPFTQFI